MEPTSERFVGSRPPPNELRPLWVCGGASLFLFVAGEILLRMGLDFAV